MARSLGEIEAKIGSDAGSYTGITADSRAVKPGMLFVAIRGEAVDGHRFIQDALKHGATTVVAEASDVSAYDSNIVLVSNSREALARLAHAYYGYPSKKLLSIGVTGTNGKTSVAWIVSEALALRDISSAHLGTLGKRFKEPGAVSQFQDLDNTTPDSLITYAFLGECLARGASACVMEVSSHALMQQRTRGLEWDGVVFTNLTRDHLDFHGSMEEYRAAKERLFRVELAESKKALRFFVVSVDDETGRQFAAACKRELPGVDVISVSAGLPGAARIGVAGVQYLGTGTAIEVLVDGAPKRLNSRLLGEYNVSNMLTALGVLLGTGVGVDEALALLSGVPPVPGRLELVEPHDVRVFVDYAHTPDALSRAQRSLREITTGKLITVFGCGGNRDRGKRPLMAKAVEEISDVAIVTSDNPRNEDPAAIVDEAVRGFSGARGARDNFAMFVEVDRSAAIKRAIELAQPGDSVLIAGKGHEPYQEVCGVKHPFSDSQVARELLRGMS